MTMAKHRPDSPRPKRSKVKVHKGPTPPPCLVMALALVSVPAGLVYAGVAAWQHWA
jgi:hypothetical protein